MSAAGSVRFPSIVIALLFACMLPPAASPAPADDARSASAAASAAVSAASFDWRAALPELDKAAGLSEEDGIRDLLETLPLLRAYMARELAAQAAVQDQAVTDKIDAVVRQELFHHRDVTRVDYPLKHQPFPFTFVAAVKTRKHHDAYLVLYFADKTYTAAQVQAKYGAPPSASIVGAASLYTYKVDTPTYSARATFTIEPVDGSVDRLAISLRRKPARN